MRIAFCTRRGPEVRSHKLRPKRHFPSGPVRALPSTVLVTYILCPPLEAPWRALQDHRGVGPMSQPPDRGGPSDMHTRRPRHPDPSRWLPLRREGPDRLRDPTSEHQSAIGLRRRLRRCSRHRRRLIPTACVAATEGPPERAATSTRAPRLTSSSASAPCASAPAAQTQT